MKHVPFQEEHTDQLPAQKIVHLAVTHPERDPRIFLKECRSLASQGFQITLIGNSSNDSVEEGVQIRKFARKNIKNRFFRLLDTTWRLYRVAIRENGDAYHFHETPILLVGLLLKLRGKKVVWDVHEIVADQIYRMPWLPESVRKPASIIFTKFQKRIGLLFDGIVVAWPGIANTFPNANLVVVRNFPIITARITETIPQPSKEGLKVTYVGGITEIRGIFEMVRAVARVNERLPLRLVLGGEFLTESLRCQVTQEPGWQYVEELGWLDEAQKYRVYGESVAGLLLLNPEIRNHQQSEPNKLFEYMLAGLPVISTDIPYYRQFVEDLGTGLMVDARDPQAIADAITWICEHPEEAREMGRRGRQAVLERFNWEQEAEKLFTFYRTRVFGQ